jgi:hypothetical protein
MQFEFRLSSDYTPCAVAVRGAKSQTQRPGAQDASAVGKSTPSCGSAGSRPCWRQTLWATVGLGADKVGTLHALSGNRRDLTDRTIASHGGRTVKATGDGMLVEFASAVGAVRCAVFLL